MSRRLAACRIWVLRPQGLQHQLCQAIRDKGGEAVELPVSRITDIPLEASVFEGKDGIIFVSRNAVRAVERHAASLRQAAVYAVGDGTAAELRRLGCGEVVSAGARGGSESLLDDPGLAAAKVRDRDWLIVCGTVSRELLPETLRSRGARVSIAVAYRSDPMEYGQEKMEELWQQPPDVIAAYSVAELSGLLRLSPQSVKPDLLATPLAALSGRIMEQARQAGFAGDIEVAPSTSDHGCLDAILALAGRKSRGTS